MTKLFKLDLSVVVFVDFFQELGKYLVLVLDSEGALDLIRRDRAASVFIEQAESCL